MYYSPPPQFFSHFPTQSLGKPPVGRKLRHPFPPSFFFFFFLITDTSGFITLKIELWRRLYCFIFYVYTCAPVHLFRSSRVFSLGYVSSLLSRQVQYAAVYIFTVQICKSVIAIKLLMRTWPFAPPCPCRCLTVCMEYLGCQELLSFNFSKLMELLSVLPRADNRGACKSSGALRRLFRPLSVTVSKIG